jgi:hypothetical protein
VIYANWRSVEIGEEKAVIFFNQPFLQKGETKL